MRRSRRTQRTSKVTLEMRVLQWIPRLPYGLVARREVEHLERIPANGPCLIVANHVTEIDPLTVGFTVIDAGRMPSFLAKESLFRIPVLGFLLHRVGQVPVHRGTRDSARALSAAEQRLAEGGSVGIYPEGTLTRDPLRWPMHSFPGAARLALGLDVPVIPLAHWGDQEILGRDEHWRLRVSLWPRKRVRVRVGEPVDLSRFAARLEATRASAAAQQESAPDTGTASGAVSDDQEATARADHAPSPEERRVAAVPHALAVEATEAILDAIAAELSVLRQEPVPATRWDSRLRRRR